MKIDIKCLSYLRSIKIQQVNMRTVKIGFSKSKKRFPWGSWIIRLYQWSPFSHTYARIETKSLGSDTFLHASEGKVQRMSQPQFEKRHEIVKEFSIELDDFEYSTMMHHIHYFSGDDYSALQNLGIMIVDFLRLFGIRATNPWQKGWNCSEFVTTVLKPLYPCQFEKVDPNTVTPKEIYNILILLETEGLINN